LATKTPPPPVVCHSDSAIIELQSAAVVAKPWRPLVRSVYFFLDITMRNNIIISARALKRSSPTDLRNFRHRRNDDETDLGISVGICRVIGVAGRIAAGAHGIRNGNSDVIPNSVSGIIRDGDLKIHPRDPPRTETAQRFPRARIRSRRPRGALPIVW